MHLYKTSKGNIIRENEKSYLIEGDWDTIINQSNLYQFLYDAVNKSTAITEGQSIEILENYLLPPIGTQEVWAAGVTYLRSRDARMEESEDSGAADCYSRVYEAERPELFFKSLPHRVAGHKQKLNIRKDSTWNVPEPELALYINSKGSIQAYTIGNDMSSRSIEGENPLYLPQAKMYEGSAGLGPCLYVPNAAIPPGTAIKMNICRNNVKLFDDGTSINRMKRTLTELAHWLYLEFEFNYGCFLMTGTCVVPPNDFTLQENDEVNIEIDGIGTLTNTIGVRK
jgi:2-dehydro-3-deoxy-D-arabinonate dehydratase